MTCPTSSPGPSFPLDWKTTKLPPSETFQPYIAAVTSPSLFYLLTSSPGQNIAYYHQMFPS